MYQPDELFRSTAPYYARYRAGYPEEFFDHLQVRFALDGTQRVLDLGCGTGQIAIPLAPRVKRVYAVDPEPAMLEEGNRHAKQHDTNNIDWIRGDSNHIDVLNLPELAIVTIGAAFHWMDRTAVLANLDQLVSSGGAVVIASGGPPDTRTPPPWETTIAEIRARYLGSERRAGSTTYSHPAEGHADVLRRSAFSAVDTVTWTRTLDRDLDSVIGLQFSFSYSAPAQFTSEQQRAKFEIELRNTLSAANPSGVFREQITTEAIIGSRP
jgi:ubiquinone/menaquinone biosynthesis C-methylase UbiE